MANYAYESAPNERLARARVDGVNASFKDLCNVCGNVRGRRADGALVFLTEAANRERPVRLFTHNKHRGHVGELGGKKGGWPVKSCAIVRDVLENAIANADKLGLGQCKIIHIQANKQVVYGRMASKGGKRGRSNLETAFVEIVLRELQIPGNVGKKVEKKDEKKETKKTDEKKTDANKTETAKPATSPVVEAKKVEVPKVETRKVEQKITA